ncbi:O-antigen ligase family protein [Halomonas maura]|uniref:O-antigen ligase family protein n=1 Tax=Halomonas maura TaxID=117606 RepID=UPI0025B28153|nr:O-antigen ligase family protein [Halomonas maura]MDN3555249.1 O-antigen ligase family protein [Halomonas maura]
MILSLIWPRPATQGDDPWRRGNTLLLWAFVSLLILVPWGYAAVPLAAGLLALCGVLARRGPTRQYPALLDGEDWGWLLVLATFAGLWCWDVARTGQWPVAEHARGWLMPLWPLLAAALLIWLRRHPPSRIGWWLGLLVGGQGAGAIAMHERFVLGAYRADNGMNAIPFGNLALLLGVLALVAMLGRLSLSRRPFPWLTAALGLTAVAGFAASFLSGTRGGWVVVPLLAWMGFRAFRGVFSRRRMLMAAAGFWGLLAGLVAMTALTDYGVSSRIERAMDDARDYVVEGDSGNSVGLRLEMWHAGGQLFLEKPLTGWGEGHLQAARDAMVEAGVLHSGVSQFDQLHSDIIDTAARRGVLGLLTLGALYGVPAWLFARHLHRSRDPQTRTLALSGLMVAVAFVDFGLTQSMLRDARGLSGYLGLSVACWVLLKAHLVTLRLREAPQGQA